MARSRTAALIARWIGWATASSPIRPAWLGCTPPFGGSMVVIRGLGWLLLAMALAAIVHDGLTWWSDGSFHLLGLGDLWSRLDIRSLGDTQSAVQRHLSGALWTWVLRPVLIIPPLPPFLPLALLLPCLPIPIPAT